MAAMRSAISAQTFEAFQADFRTQQALGDIDQSELTDGSAGIHSSQLVE